MYIFVLLFILNPHLIGCHALFVTSHNPTFHLNILLWLLCCEECLNTNEPNNYHKA